MHDFRLPIALALLALPAASQSLNLRFTTHGPTPPPNYGAMTGQAGAWNAVNTPVGGPLEWVQTPLVGLDGNAVLAHTSMSGCDAENCIVSGFGADVQALFAGQVNSDCHADASTTVLVDLEAGHYVLTALGSPCVPLMHGMQVKLGDNSYNQVQQLGGTYAGSFGSMTPGTFEFTKPAGVNVSWTGGIYGYLSAVQLARIEPPAVYCTSKVNSQGCAAKIAAIGNAASLSDTSPFHIVASDVVNDVPGLLFYGFGADVKPFLGGLHCVKPPTPRVWGQFSNGNGVPCAGAFDQDFNAWLSWDPQPKVYAGARLYAQYWYRDVDDPFGSATSDAVSFHVVH